MRHPLFCTVSRLWRAGMACLALSIVTTAALAQSDSLSEQQEAIDFSIDTPAVMLQGVPFEQTIRVSEPPSGKLELVIGQERFAVEPDQFEQIDDDIGHQAVIEKVSVSASGAVEMRLLLDDEPVASSESRVIPGWLSVLPAVIAIFVALITRQVIPALFFGIVLGAWMTYGFTASGLWYGILDSVQVYVLEALVPPSGDKGHISVVVFTLMMGGLIGIIYRNGGAHAIADRISKVASTRKRGQLATSGLGFTIFFSTYANSLIVGNTMRPVTDRLKISREKLAYIVDSTAAPLAAIAIISTWIGFELGLIESSMKTIGFDENAYSIFLQSIPYNFYPILSLFFVLLIGFSGRDFGPMARAEKRALEEGKVMRDGADVDANAREDEEEGGELTLKEGVTKRSINALLPIGVLIMTVAVGLYTTGSGDSLREIIGSAESSKVLVWSGLLGVLVAATLSIGQRLLTMKETVAAWYAGLKSVLFVMIILTLAWSLAAIAVDLMTANYLVSVLGDSVRPEYLPAILFVLSAAVSFAVGTSWGTMGILMPLAVPLIWTILQSNDMAGGEYNYILYATVATILAGSVWGDHCSPISDTTIISSVAAGSDHIDHVRTQMPYALLVGVVSLVFGLLPVGYGIPWWIMMPVAALVLTASVYLFGTPLPDADAAQQGEAEKSAENGTDKATVEATDQASEHDAAQGTEADPSRQQDGDRSRQDTRREAETH